VDEVEHFGRGNGIPQVSAGIQIQTICAIGLNFGKKPSWIARSLPHQADQSGFGRVSMATIRNKHRKYTNLHPRLERGWNTRFQGLEIHTP